LSIGSFPDFSAGSPAGGAGVANSAPGIDATNPRLAGDSAATRDSAGKDGAVTGSGATDDVVRGSADPFTTMARQLDRWGARQYALERLAGEVAIFRFRCLMSDPRSREGIRTFEAQASDPLSAMGEALGKVARWKARER